MAQKLIGARILDGKVECWARMGIRLGFSLVVEAEHLSSTKSLFKAPKSTLRWWGLQSAPAFDFVAETLHGHGCTGPTTWKEGALIPFKKDLGPTIKAMLGLSASTADGGYAAFGCSAVIFSKTLFELSKDSDPWMGGPAEPVFSGFEPCIVFRLQHMKWCEREDDVNPNWAMTLGDDTVRPNAHVWAADFARLFVPLLDSLSTDEALEAVLTRALSKVKPSWVKSDAPYFVELPARLERIRSRTARVA